MPSVAAKLTAAQVGGSEVILILTITPRRGDSEHGLTGKPGGGKVGNSRRGGGIGIHRGLKILGPTRACGFDSRPRHQANTRWETADVYPPSAGTRINADKEKGTLEPLKARFSDPYRRQSAYIGGLILVWSRREESNPQPADYKSAALPLSSDRC